MKLDKLELFVHDHILKNKAIRGVLYGMYQRLNVTLAPQKPKDSLLRLVSPEDGYEYFFGYYDKCPWSHQGDSLLALQVKDSTVRADSSSPAHIVLLSLEGEPKVRVLAQTHSWNVQQGCMLQWLNPDEILFNDFRDGRNCAVILNIHTGKERLLSRPVYTLSPDGKTALSLDFSRLHSLRPGYGYVNVPDHTLGVDCPEEGCIWRIDLRTGDSVEILKYTDFMAFEHRADMEGAAHKVNHLMINPSGDRFMVIHRWLNKDLKFSRLVTANLDGSALYNLSDDDFVSHCCWKDGREIIAYLRKKDGGKAYYHIKDQSADYRKIWPELVMDGHPSFSPDGSLAVTDTYPNRKRIQSLYTIKDDKVSFQASVFSPFRFAGDVRCDLHPRWNRQGNEICFDGSHKGKRAIFISELHCEE